MGPPRIPAQWTVRLHVHVGKTKEFYNQLKPPLYISTMHKEQDKDHKLHDNDLIGPLHLFQ
jgi:hypothetical protein